MSGKHLLGSMWHAIVKAGLFWKIKAQPGGNWWKEGQTDIVAFRGESLEQLCERRLPGRKQSTQCGGVTVPGWEDSQVWQRLSEGTVKPGSAQVSEGPEG